MSIPCCKRSLCAHPAFDDSENLSGKRFKIPTNKSSRICITQRANVLKESDVFKYYFRPFFVESVIEHILISHVRKKTVS